MVLFLLLQFSVHYPLLQWYPCRSVCGLAIMRLYLPIADNIDKTVYYSTFHKLWFHTWICLLGEASYVCHIMLQSFCRLPHGSWIPTSSLWQDVFVQIPVPNGTRWCHSEAVLRAPAVLVPLGVLLELLRFPWFHCLWTAAVPKLPVPSKVGILKMLGFWTIIVTCPVPSNVWLISVCGLCSTTFP